MCNEEIINAIKVEIQKFRKDDFKECFEKWIYGLKKCIEKTITQIRSNKNLFIFLNKFNKFLLVASCIFFICVENLLCQNLSHACANAVELHFPPS